MRLLFVRHAETLANREGRLQGRCNYPLSDRGRLQAERLFSRFAAEGLHPTRVYSSPLHRTMETAQIASKGWTEEIRPWPDLVEYDVGVFSGLTWPEIVSRHPRMARAFDQSQNWDVVAQAEPVKQRRERACRVVEAIIKEHTDDDVVVCFSHGGILQHIVSAMLGTQRVWGIAVRNTAVFEFMLDKQRWTDEGSRLNTSHWRIATFNDASHLYAEASSVDGPETAGEA